MAYIKWTKRSGSAPDADRRAVAEFRTAFKEYPDVVATATAQTADATLSADGGKAAVEALRKEERRLTRDGEPRADLVVNNIMELVAGLLAECGEARDAKQMVRDAEEMRKRAETFAR